MKPLTYTEALEWARKQGIVLPDEYYGLLFGRARAAAFSVAGVSALDQLQAIHDSLLDVMDIGGTFAQWRKDALDGKIPMDFPDHRLETTFRTNIQGWYSAGRCRSDQANKENRPYLMYSAINDSRTRPAHAAMDNTILPVDHQWWDDHRPPNGFNCRCSSISLSEEEAEEFGGVTVIAPDAMPDNGWDYSPCKHGPEEGVRRATESRTGRCGQQHEAGIPVELAIREPWWCRDAQLRRAVADYLASMNAWDDRNRIIREAMGKKKYLEHASKVEHIIGDYGLTIEQGVMLRAYTDRHHYFGTDGDTAELYVALNNLGRLMAHLDEPLPFTGNQLYQAGVMLLVLDEALEKLPKQSGAVWRGVDVATMPDDLRHRWKAAHRKGSVVQYNGYTSIMSHEGGQYTGDWQIQMYLESMRDIGPFSVNGESELLLPRGVQLEYRGFEDGYRVMGERLDRKNVKKARNFEADESEVEAWIDMGYTRDRAIEILRDMKETSERWKAQRGQPISKEKQQWMNDMYERMQAEATAGLTK